MQESASFADECVFIDKDFPLYQVNFKIYHYIFLLVELANLKQLNFQWKNLLNFLMLYLDSHRFSIV